MGAAISLGENKVTDILYEGNIVDGQNVFQALYLMRFIYWFIVFDSFFVSIIAMPQNKILKIFYCLRDFILLDSFQTNTPANSYKISFERRY